MKQYINKINMPAMLGAAVEYYDIALYGFMAPVLIKVFLPWIPKTKAYFIYFLFEFVASICQLLGARYFGKMGDTKGRKKAMYYSMLGTSTATFLITIVPDYQSFGIFATISFLSARALQCFFLGGGTGGAIYCLEHEKDINKHGAISGLYCAMTVSGIIIASLVATLVNHLGPEYFRLAYALSFFLALFTYFIRKKLKETPEFLNFKRHNTHTLQQQNTDIPKSYIIHMTLMIAFLRLFFGMIYGAPTRIFNAILPLATGIAQSQIMIINDFFLIFYMVLLIFFGFMSDKFGARKLMKFSVFASLIITYPLILLISTKELVAIIVAKALFALLAAAFIGPFHVFSQQTFKTEIRYKQISVGYSLGKCFATLLLSFSVLLYDHTQSLNSIGLVLIVIALISLGLLSNSRLGKK